MGKNVLNPEEAAELDRLYAELPAARQRVADALLTNRLPLEGQWMARLVDEENKVSAILRRIKEILGT